MRSRYTKGAALIIAVIMILSVGLLGCSKGADTSDATTAAGKTTSAPAEKAEKPAKTEVVKVFSSIGAYKALLEQKIAEWNETVGKEKGIRIEMETNIDKYRDVLEIALKAGNPPDLYTIESRVAQYATNGWAKAIEDIEGGPELIKQYEGMLKPIVHQEEHLPGHIFYAHHYQCRHYRCRFQLHLCFV
jgi:ABC-type glycerol-3-phosphate transport system substrate-binding protein